MTGLPLWQKKGRCKVHRFFDEIEENIKPGYSLFLEGENHSHLAKSLRMRVGENLVVCNGKGTDYLCELVEVTKHQSRVLVQSIEPNRQESPVSITLYQGLPKGQKMDWIVQKSVELGIANIVPVYTSRSVARDSDKGKKTERWNRIALEAAKQSGRGIVPVVENGLDWSELLDRIQNQSLRMAAYEERQNSKLKKILKNSPIPASAAIVIGPEGGFEAWEIEELEKSAVEIVGLGPRILRTETAGIAMLSMLLYEWELSPGGDL